MHRSLSVSTDVFAAIWARRQDGEETEDDILRREFGCAHVQKSQESEIRPAVGDGVHDRRNDVHFPEGFEIFRTYKRRQFSAEARGGTWVRKDNGQLYPTLNQLNASITVGSENVWNGTWKHKTANGTFESIGHLRPSFQAVTRDKFLDV